MCSNQQHHCVSCICYWIGSITITFGMSPCWFKIAWQYSGILFTLWLLKLETLLRVQSHPYSLVEFDVCLQCFEMLLKFIVTAWPFFSVISGVFFVFFSDFGKRGKFKSFILHIRTGENLHDIPILCIMSLCSLHVIQNSLVCIIAQQELNANNILFLLYISHKRINWKRAGYGIKTDANFPKSVILKKNISIDCQENILVIFVLVLLYTICRWLVAFFMRCHRK